MRILLHLESGHDVPVECEPNELIEKLIQTASNEEAIDVVQLKLVYEGRMLDPKSTIESNNFPDGVKITVMHVLIA